MCGEAVPQRMRRYGLGDTGTANSILKHPKNVIAADRLSRRCSGKQPHLRVLVSPVLLQGLQQNWRQHHYSIFLPLALTDGDRHALRVDAADEQMGRLRSPQARGVNQHQQGAGLQMVRSNEELCDFLLTKNRGQLLLLTCERNVGQQKGSLQDLDIEESQRTHDLV